MSKHEPNPQQSKPTPKTYPRPKPIASLPIGGRGIGGRPIAASPSQRNKRRAARAVGTVTAAKKEDRDELMLFGTIGEDFWGEGITAKSFDAALKALGDSKKIHMRINSGGGDVFEATAIYNMLVKHDAEVIVEIEGVAASAATLIAMAGNEVRISENAHFMIHAASGIAWGNADELRQYLKLLDNADDLIRLTYSRRSGIDQEELKDMMSFDNWMTAQEALEYGFVDSIDEANSSKPHVTPEDSAKPKKATSLTPERLAAASGYLLALSASVRPQTETGSSPQLSTVKEQKMNPKLRAQCVKAGMDATLNDEQANTWFEANSEKVFAQPPVTTVTTTVSSTNDTPESKILDILDAREKARAAKVKAWRKEVDANLSLAFADNIPAGVKDECYALEDDGIDAVRTKIQDAKKKADESTNIGGIRVNFSPNQPRDKHIAAIRAGLMVRCLNNFKAIDDVKLTQTQILDKHFPEKDRPAGWQDFAQMPLVKIAEESLMADGISYDQIRRLPGPQIAMAAMGYHRNAGVRNAAIHTTGSLLEITRDAVNKSLTAGYEEAPQTWRGVGRQGTSVADFKDIHRVKLGAAGNLPVWPDNTAPEKAKLSNEKEKYAVEARAETLDFSWRLIVNDDLDALSRRPQLLGDAAGRTVNAVFWQQVTSNPTMADGKALFLETPAGNRMRKNLTTGAGAPSNATIGALRTLMRLMRGLNTPEQAESEDVLNLTPSFIVGPATLEEVILKQVMSTADPASGGNSGVYNTARNLVPVIEPLLDANSTTAWYLFASPGRIDTIEVTFLQGQETPYAHEWMDDETMCQNFTIIQTFGAKPLDHRGIQKHAGQ